MIAHRLNFSFSRSFTLRQHVPIIRFLNRIVSYRRNFPAWIKGARVVRACVRMRTSRELEMQVHGTLAGFNADPFLHVYIAVQRQTQ